MNMDVEIIEKKDWYICQCKSLNIEKLYLKKDYSKEFAFDDFCDELKYYEDRGSLSKPK
jgi:hypothetical protein